MTHWGDGEYWIDPEFYSSGAEENPFLVYCDMTTAQGKVNSSLQSTHLIMHHNEALW